MAKHSSCSDCNEILVSCKGWQKNRDFFESLGSRRSLFQWGSENSHKMVRGTGHCSLSSIPVTIHLQYAVSLQQNLERHAAFHTLSTHSAVTPGCLPACHRWERTRLHKGQASTLCSLPLWKEQASKRNFSGCGKRQSYSLHRAGYPNSDYPKRS